MVSSLCYVIYFSGDVNNISKKGNSVSNGVIEIEFGLLDGGKDGEHNGVGFVGISKIF